MPLLCPCVLACECNGGVIRPTTPWSHQSCPAPLPLPLPLAPQVSLPEVRQLSDLLDKAADWLARVQAASGGRQPAPPLKEMRLLLHAGACVRMHMCVCVCLCVYVCVRAHVCLCDTISLCRMSRL